MAEEQDDKKQLGIHKDIETQQMLNKPLADPSGIDLEDQKFMDKILKMVDEGDIQLHVPSSIINQSVYDKLDGEKQNAIEVKAVTILASIRELKGLYDAGYGTSFQIQNLVERLHDNVETIEDAGGDIFII